MSELGLYKDKPTTIYQDNQSAIQIAVNRGSLSDKTKSIQLKYLVARNRIEDWVYYPVWIETSKMMADMGTKALPELQFVRFRDSMNGYALAKAAYPELEWPQMVYCFK